MTLSRLDVSHLRILERLRINPSPGLNLITGLNGSGKTSVLEAIHVLATGRSFRASRIEHLISHGHRQLMVTGRIREAGGPETGLGILKSDGKTLARIEGRKVRCQSDLARRLPLQVIHPDSHELLTGPPSGRRSFMDWGLFYGGTDAAMALSAYRRALAQRNEALRQGSADAVLLPWEREMARNAAVLDSCRRSYLDSLRDLHAQLVEMWPDLRGLDWQYRRGWREGETLDVVMDKGRGRERDLGYSLWGPHRADLVFSRHGESLSFSASRGQQKIAVVALRLLQVAAFHQAGSGRALVLVDDLPSELDEKRRALVGRFLRQLNAQVFVTAIEIDPRELGEWSHRRMFHVEHGRLDTPVAGNELV